MRLAGRKRDVHQAGLEPIARELQAPVYRRAIAGARPVTAAGILARSGINSGPGLLPSSSIAVPDDRRRRERIVFEETPAASDTYMSTAQTVSKMCEYIRSSIDDPQVQAAAQFAADHFARGSQDPGMLAWAVWWYVKHCVRFRQDEATMFRIGRQNEFDLLIAPSVLVRMKDPAEDCDGFTMLTAALCAILGVPVFIATVAADGRDPERFSHVFPCAMIDGNVLPLDASHGTAPGWMVPVDRIHRWQAWNLDGQPIDVAPAKFQGLHGYARSSDRGLGQCAFEGDPTCSDTSAPDLTGPFANYGGTPSLITPTIGGSTYNPLNPNNILVATPTNVPGTSPSSSSDLTNFFASLFGNAAKVAGIAETPTTTVTLPNGTVVSGITSGAAGSLLSGANLTSLLPILGIGIVALIAFSFIGGKK